MRLSVTSWSFPQLTLDEAAAVAQAIGMEALDLGYFYRPAIDRARVLAEPEAYGNEVRAKLPLPVANLYHVFGADTVERNLARPDARAENTADFKAVLRFCKAVGSPTVFILPGVLNPGQGRKAALAETVESLKPLVAAAADAGLTLCLEPHVHSYLETPALAAEMCERAKGAKLALDYAHFTVIGYRQEEIDALAPYAGHVHLRQARPGALQTKLEEGTINFSDVFATLRDAGYGGALSCEYVNQTYFDTAHDDVLGETVKMRDLYRAWSAA
jgi:sugar phosphate isomerase/epimerase